MAYGGGFGRSRGGYGDSNGYSNGYALHNDSSVLEPGAARSTWAEASPLFSFCCFASLRAGKEHTAGTYEQHIAV